MELNLTHRPRPRLASLPYKILRVGYMNDDDGLINGRDQIYQLGHSDLAESFLREYGDTTLAFKDNIAGHQFRYRLADPEHDPTTIAPLSLSNDRILRSRSPKAAQTNQALTTRLPACSRVVILPRSTLNAMISESLCLRRYSRWLETEAASRMQGALPKAFLPVSQYPSTSTGAWFLNTNNKLGCSGISKRLIVVHNCPHLVPQLSAIISPNRVPNNKSPMRPRPYWKYRPEIKTEGDTTGYIVYSITRSSLPSMSVLDLQKTPLGSPTLTVDLLAIAILIPQGYIFRLCKAGSKHHTNGAKPGPTTMVSPSMYSVPCVVQSPAYSALNFHDRYFACKRRETNHFPTVQQDDPNSMKRMIHLACEPDGKRRRLRGHPKPGRWNTLYPLRDSRLEHNSILYRSYASGQVSILECVLTPCAISHVQLEDLDRWTYAPLDTTRDPAPSKASSGPSRNSTETNRKSSCPRGERQAPLMGSNGFRLQRFEKPGSLPRNEIVCELNEEDRGPVMRVPRPQAIKQASFVFSYEGPLKRQPQLHASYALLHAVRERKQH
ncbi:hypothetical protein CCUS01_11039 [Colletotrichum cuscutae]|uniref:Uncharacterized protein n=1 Tax=Colletotrichum cuscutae TaxID=1209917 RepID=A0AAI9XKF4_9PEZI|nr:hypothetical protein CCUS01_11039 [Colletotrichum cuscutae]